MYIFDTLLLSSLFRNFYRSRFPTLWKQFDALADDGRVTSTREVRRELDRYSQGHEQLLDNHRYIFTTPTAAEAQIILEIYAVRHFQHNVEQKKIQAGGLNADLFVVAKAHVNGSIVVTLEEERPDGAKIPNICRHLGVPWLNLEGFMERESWIF